MAGTEVVGAPQFGGGGGLPGVSRTLGFLVHGQACRPACFSSPKRLSSCKERSLIAGHPAAMAWSFLQAICACYHSIMHMFSASPVTRIEITRPALPSTAPFKQPAEDC